MRRYARKKRVKGGGQPKRGGRVKGNQKRAARRWIIRALIDREGGICQSCQRQVNLIKNDPMQASVDHHMPQSKGGGDNLSNVRLLCRRCNGAKADSVPSEKAES